MIHTMDPATEVRKLPPSVIRELGLILDYADSWKRLMVIIPKRLSRNGYGSHIAPDNLPKYNSEDFKTIEQGSIRYNRSCTEILFDEWGTSGRPRASLGHLKYLLTKAKLFRAADFVAELLGEDPPPRPATGPAALVTVDLSEIAPHIDPETAAVERRLDEINYPQVAIEKIRKNSLEVKHHVQVIPEIVVSEVRTAPDAFQIPLIIPRAKSQTPPSEVPDMTQFSEENVAAEVSNGSVVLPQLSLLLNNEERTTSQTSSPGDSEGNASVPQQASQESDGSMEIPKLSLLLGSEDESSPQLDFTPAFSQLLPEPSQQSVINSLYNSEDTGDEYIPCESDLIPALSALNQDIPESKSSLIPNFDMLQSDNDFSIPLRVSSSNSSSKTSSSSPTKCSSPLPNLSLNTQLPHFSYADLEAATNSFSSEAETSRFLGKGAFGSVFLALGVMEKPVAVKKIFLENVEMVNEGDQVTKQFKNEVEVLYKYKHENLVSLLGYSCDGCTYCLVYEYVPGGSLFDILEKYPQTLTWTQRVHIALGTARAVAYLHTAFPTPLIHRDIKSANILLDADKNAKLCDFGIVKLLPGQNTDLETAPCGTSAYMSPEYHRGEISIKLDTFSFGVVLLELLTSLPPLDYKRQGADLVTYVEDHCEHSIDPLLDNTIGTWEENGVNFAEELYSLTQKCLEDKKKRPVMVDVVKSLEDIEGKLHS